MKTVVRYFKVLTLPEVGEPNAFYLLENGGHVEIYVTTDDGEIRSAVNSAMIAALVAEAVGEIDSTINSRTVIGTAVALNADDNGNIIVTTNNSGIVLTIPAGLGANFAVGIIHRGDGLITPSPAGGVTLNNADGHTKLRKGMSSFYSVTANDFEFGGATE